MQASLAREKDRQSAHHSLRNVASTAITLRARKQDWTEVIQERVFREGCLEEAHRS